MGDRVEASEPIREFHARDIINEGGNLAIGDNNRQVIFSESQPAIEIRRLVDQIRNELVAMTDLPTTATAEEALTEISEVLTDGPVPTRPQRMDRARRKLMSALDGVTRFATPLAQLAAAIAELLRAKP